MCDKKKGLNGGMADWMDDWIGEEREPGQRAD